MGKPPQRAISPCPRDLAQEPPRDNSMHEGEKPMEILLSHASPRSVAAPGKSDAAGRGPGSDEILIQARVNPEAHISLSLSVRK